MMRIALFVFSSFLPLSVAASHGWADFDLCQLYKDKLPPGLTAESLPAPQSHGAALLLRYCTQCHNLPGPDRHTAAAWRGVTSKMFMLMDVSHQFGGLMGKVEIVPEAQQAILLTYLENHAASQSTVSKASTESNLRLTNILPLTPFVLLIGLGFLRWWKHHQRDLQRAGKPCAHD